MYPKSVQNFIDKFSKLPSIGPRQAARLAFWILKQPKSVFFDLRKSLEGLAKTKTCQSCFFVIENEANSQDCPFCSNPNRNHSMICVVEKETDLASLEKSGVYKGLYHILDGLFSPLDNTMPIHLKVPELISRITAKPQEIKEIIIALSPTHEGDVTAYHLENLLKPLKIKITRLARGLPWGSEVEFADSKTLSGALESRKELN